MAISQIHYSQLDDRESGFSAAYLSVPALELGGDVNFYETAEVLGLEVLLVDFAPAQLASLWVGLLARSDPNAASDLVRAVKGMAHPEDEGFAKHRKFANELAFGPVVPVRSSPLDLSSLASVLAEASGVGTGAIAGLVAAGGTPFVLVTVPAGMILGGAAAGVAKALGEGLYSKIRVRMGLPAEPTESRDG